MPVVRSEERITTWSPRQQVALLARLLWRAGYNDGVAGHISMRLDDGTLLCTPYGPSWATVAASDVVHLAADGTFLDGRWPPNAAIVLHLVVHERRPDAVFTVHHHPEWATVWAAARRVPPVYDQFSAFVADDLVLYDDYRGGVDEREVAIANVAALGDATKALLANHGVLVIAPSVQLAHLRCAALEHRCRLAWRVEAIGGGAAMDRGVAQRLGRTFDDDHGGWQEHFDAMVRVELAADAQVLG